MSARTVTSLTNPTVKAVRALHLRKEREESGLFLAEGLKIITEAVELGHAPRILLHGPDAGHPLLTKAIAAAEAASGEVIEVTPGILEKISRRENPQMVIAVFPQVFTPLEALEPETAACWVALDRVRDPGNLGTVVRTADYRRPTMILMGNEQQGLPPDLAAACDLTVKIPMRGRADSLNLAVATGIMIYTVTG